MSKNFTRKVCMATHSLSSDALRTAGIPRLFWTLGLDSFPGDPNACDFVRKYIRSFKKSRTVGAGFFIQGGPCSGKTFLGTFVLKMALVSCQNVRYTTLSDLTQQLLGSSEHRGISIPNAYGTTVDFLFVDDLPNEPNRGEISALARVLQVRKQTGAPVILASELDLNSMAAAYSPDVYKRISLMRELKLADAGMAFKLAANEFETQQAIWDD